MYKTATNSAPRTCLCGSRLGKPQYGFPWVDEKMQKLVGITVSRYRVPVQGKLWHINCKCHRTYIWAFPNIWVVRSELPLLDTQETVG